MTKRRLTITATMLTGAVGALLLLSCFPIMKVSAGCECGYQRSWYEMPDSLWHRHRLFLHIEKLGNPGHPHQMWDAQWGVWSKLPWQK